MKPVYLLLIAAFLLLLAGASLVVFRNDKPPKMSPEERAAVENALSVDPGFLLWKEGLEYQTAVTAEFSLTNTKMIVRMDDRKDAHGWQDRSFHYQGTLVYSTWLQDAYTMNGSAGRYYGQCDISKIEATPATIRIPSSGWEVTRSRVGSLFGKELPAQLRDKVEIVERQAHGDPHITVQTLPGVEEEALGVYTLAAGFQELQDLTSQDLILEWNRMAAFEKGKLAINPAVRDESGSGRLSRSGGAPSVLVQEVVGRESKLLYGAMLGGGVPRRDGDVWEIPAEALEAMIHPSIKGQFHGSVVVGATVVQNESPHSSVFSSSAYSLRIRRAVAPLAVLMNFTRSVVGFARNRMCTWSSSPSRFVSSTP